MEDFDAKIGTSVCSMDDHFSVGAASIDFISRDISIQGVKELDSLSKTQQRKLLPMPKRFYEVQSSFENMHNVGTS